MSNDPNILKDAMTKVWNDPEYRQRMNDNPKKTLEEAGMTFPDDIQFNIVENKPDLINLVFPPN